MSKRYFKVVAFGLPLVFFLGVAIIDGPIWCVDSPGYDAMYFSREPVYPLFLALLRNLFAKIGLTGTLYDLPSYLFGAVIIQSLLWSYSVTRLAIYIKDNFGIFQSYLAIFFQLTVASLNRFVANRQSMYSESILTEALAMPLFVVANVCLWELFSEFRISSLLKIFILSVLIASIRKQMLVVLLVWMGAAAIFYICSKSERSFKRFLISFCMGILALVSTLEIDKTYNYYLRGVHELHTGNSRGTVSTLLYTASDDSIQLFSGYADSEEYPNLGELYAKVYAACVEEGYVIENSPDFSSRDELSVLKRDWIRDTDFFTSVYDLIGYDVLLTSCNEYVREHFPELDMVHAELKEDQTEKEIMKVLLKDTISKAFAKEGKAARYVFATNVLRALIISVSNISSKSLVVISGIAYVLFLATFLICLFKKRHDIVRICIIVMLGIAVNSVVTGAVIFPQPRYMCYSMGLFYLTIACGILYSV